MSRFNFQRVLVAGNAVKRQVAVAMATTAQNYSLDAFRKQSYGGEAWEEVQRRIPGTSAYKYPARTGLSRRTSPILVRTGRLRREVSKMAAAARITYSKYDFRVQMRINSSNVPYAQYLQKGTDQMPARKFMGNTPELRRLLKLTVKRQMDRIWQA